MMGSTFPSHQLGNGLHVSGEPELPKEKPPTMSSTAMPYTGGDIKKCGELGKMFDQHVEKSRKYGPLNAPLRKTPFRGASPQSGPATPNACGRFNYSGSLPSAVPCYSPSLIIGGSNRQRCNSGPLKHGGSVKKSSGPQSGSVSPMAYHKSSPLPPVLPATGLIISGPVFSRPFNSPGAPQKVSGPLESAGSKKLPTTSIVHNQAVTKLGQDDDCSFNGSLPKPFLWWMCLLFMMGFLAGGFILGAVHNAILLIVILVIFGAVVKLFIWNALFGSRSIIGFIACYPVADLRTAKSGQYVKVSGVVTCGNVTLQSSFHKVPRCVYTSASLHEYRGWGLKPANSQHCHFTWGLRSSEKHVVDFYVSEFRSGLRALVKTGHGARVTPYVDESIVVDVNPNNKDLSPEFLRWLQERNLSSDDRVMRLREGYIKEGSAVSVMGVVQRIDNVVMIVPPSEPLSIGCQWARCILPATLEGIVLRSDETSKLNITPV